MKNHAELLDSDRCLDLFRRASRAYTEEDYHSLPRLRRRLLAIANEVDGTIQAPLPLSGVMSLGVSPAAAKQVSNDINLLCAYYELPPIVDEGW